MVMELSSSNGNVSLKDDMITMLRRKPETESKVYQVIERPRDASMGDEEETVITEGNIDEVITYYNKKMTKKRVNSKLKNRLTE